MRARVEIGGPRRRSPSSRRSLCVTQWGQGVCIAMEMLTEAQVGVCLLMGWV